MASAALQKRVVKRIVNIKEDEGGKRKFEVEWENTWENEEDLKDLAQNLIEEFLKGQSDKNNNGFEKSPPSTDDVAKEDNAEVTDVEKNMTNDDTEDEESRLTIDEESETDVCASNLFAFTGSRKRKAGKGINAIISRLQKTQQEGLFKQNQPDKIDLNKPIGEASSGQYIAKTPLSPTAGSEAPDLPTNASSQYNVVIPSQNPPRDVISTSTSSSAMTQTLRTTQTLELIQRLPSGITTVVRNLPPGTIFYEPSQLRTATGQPLVPNVQSHQVFKCSICSEIFTDEGKFKQHNFMHEQLNLLKNDPPKLLKPGTYECKFCHAIFDDKDKLKKHYDEKHAKEFASTQPSDQLYQCALCDLSFLQYNALVQHQQTHTQRKEVYILPKQMQNGTIITADGKLATPIVLDTSKITNNEQLLEKVNTAMKESIRIKKEQYEGSPTTKEETNPPPSMTTLDFQPVNDALMSKASAGERKMFRCNICDELFETEDARAKHSLVHVNRSSSLDCHICGKQFRHRTNLSTHMIVHSGIKPHQCHICLRRFTQKVNLQRHMHIHDGSRPFTCRMCQKSFTQKANLQRHILSHTECTKEDVIQALNEIPNESEVNNAINESLSEAMSVVMDKRPSQSTVAKPDYQCDVCDKVFTQKINLQKHMVTHTGVRPYQCFVCGKAFRQRITLQKHYSVHTNGSSSFTCQTCHRPFVSKTNLQRHMLSHVIPNTNQCYLCEHPFTSSDNLERHFSEHVEEATGIAIPQKFFDHRTPGQTYRCATCDIIFGSPMIFSQHLQCHQRALLPDSNLLDIGDPNKAYEESQSCPLQCNNCELTFTSVAKLEQHMSTHASESQSIVSTSPMIEVSVQPTNHIPMIGHTTSESSSSVGQPEDEPPNKIFKAESEESSILPASPSARPSRCPVCKDMFSSKEEMQKHYSTAHLKTDHTTMDDEEEDELEEEEEIEGEDDNVFDEVDVEGEAEEAVEDGINDHQQSIITENEERLIKENQDFIKDNILGGPGEYEMKGRYERGNYSCKICNRVLTYKYSLEKHMLLHTGSFPYKCHICSKRFNHKANLDKHLVVHSGEKPYVCHICSRPFSQKSNLQRHQLTHTQNRDFVCEVCGKRFNHMASLKTHSLIHTGAKPFACYVCHKRFNQKGNLKRHVQTHRTGKRNAKMRQSSSNSDGMKMEPEMMSPVSPAESYESQSPFNVNTYGEETTSPARQSERVRVKKQMDDYEFYGDDEPLPTMIGDASSSDTTPSASVTSYQEIRGVKDEIVTVMPSDALENNSTPTPIAPQPVKTTSSKLKKDTYHCDTCSKLFVSMESLETHKKSAHSSIICETCGKQFSQKANLLKHKLIHLNKKPFPCKVCNKAFRQKANLQRHELIHSKDRKTVSCTECKKTFRCSWSLKQHMKNHQISNGVIPQPQPGDNFLYGCSICGKTYKDKDQLQIHFAVHQQSPSAFGCGVCNQIYPTKEELLEHMQKHDATQVIAYDGPANPPIKSN